MSGEFETYAMRGLVVLMGAIIGAFLMRELRGKDALWKVVNKNREDHENALKDARTSFARALERVSDQFRQSIDALNITLGALGTTVSQLDRTMAREYATKDDLRDTRKELREELNCHAENCPLRFGGGR